MNSSPSPLQPVESYLLSIPGFLLCYVQCREIEENLRKNNGKRAYQLVKDLTTVKLGKATTVQGRSRKCLTEEREILNRWTEYYTELCNHKANGDPSVLDWPLTDTDDDHPIHRKDLWRLQYNH